MHLPRIPGEYVVFSTTLTVLENLCSYKKFLVVQVLKGSYGVIRFVFRIVKHYTMEQPKAVRERYGSTNGSEKIFTLKQKSARDRRKSREMRRRGRVWERT